MESSYTYLEKENFVYTEFLITFKCNYKCSYCFFSHSINTDAYMFMCAGPILARNNFEKQIFKLLKKFNILTLDDAFRNYSLEKWRFLFRNIYKDRFVYLSFTGGEPLIYWKEISFLIYDIASVSRGYIIRFDTNGSIIPNFSREIIKNITYNVSYHKKYVVSQDNFFSHLEKLSHQGKIYMVNMVIENDDEMLESENLVRSFREKGYFLNISPAFFDIRKWNQKSKEILKRLMHPFDFECKIEGKHFGKVCTYPKFGFQLLPNGYAWVWPCSKKMINLMQKKDIHAILHKNSLICPVKKCTCFHQYSFLENIKRNKDSMDIMLNFTIEQLIHRGHIDLQQKLMNI